MAWLTRHRQSIDPARVRATVEAAERRTSAEIVVSVAPFFIGNVWKVARRAFVRLGVARTRAHNGVLLFVVPSRRQLIVMGDDGIHARLGEPLWQDVASLVAASFGRGHGTRGLVDGIARLGDALSAPFPRLHDDVNELPDAPDGLIGA